MLEHLVETQNDWDQPKTRKCGVEREEAERTAKRWSLKDEFSGTAGVVYVVAMDGFNRVGHQVIINGRVDRTEGQY